MSWRGWLYSILSTDTDVLSIVPSKYIFSFLRQKPDVVPFILIRIGEQVDAPVRPGTFQYATIWVHDDPIGYKRIGQVLEYIKEAVLSAEPIESNQYQAKFAGMSRDLVDDELKTVTRNIEFRLVGKEPVFHA